MRTILCVDDHRPTLSTLALVLRSAGYRCLTAENAEEADRRFVGNSIDLVIVDHSLPRIAGDVLAAHLKEIRPVQVLMLTANLDSQISGKAVDLVLIKPQDPESLLASIAELLASSKS